MGKYFPFANEAKTTFPLHFSKHKLVSTGIFTGWTARLQSVGGAGGDEND